MFRGSVPAIVSQIADEHMSAWKADDVGVGCSGAFTVERHLSQHKKTLHSNDVLLYSAAIGGYCSGQPFPLRLTDEGKEQMPWLDQYLTDPASSLAALLVASSAAVTVGRKDDASPYYEKLRHAYEEQFPTLHAQMMEGVKGSTLRIERYYSEDVFEYLDRVPDTSAFVAYPPFQATGAASYFARDFERLERIFAWDAPDYQMLEGDPLQALYEKIADRREWLFAVNRPVPGFEDHLRAVAQTTNRAPRIHVYGSGGPVRRVQPHQQVDPPKIRHLTPGIEIGEHMTLSLLTSAQFQSLRSSYMNHGIKPGMADLPIAVVVDGVLVGCFAYSFAPTFAKWEAYLPGPAAYLLSDFPVSSSDYPRLSKLIVAASLTREAQLLVQRYGRKPFRSMTTTAFSNSPVSMKYRGVTRLLKREENHAYQSSYAETLPEGDPYYGRPWQLQYGQTIGASTCDETLSAWKKKHGQRKERTL